MIPEVVRPSRRAMLGVAAAGVLTGCSSGGTTAAAARSGPAPGAAERARAAADSLGLLRRYDAAAAAHPDLAVRLAPLRSEIARHASALGANPPAAVPPAGSTPSASARPTPPAGSTPSAHPTPPAASGSATTRPPATDSAPAAPVPAVPAGSPATLAWLAAAERTLADRRAAALLTVPGDLARLLASIAAADAGHVVLLAPAPPARTGASPDADLASGPSASRSAAPGPGTSGGAGTQADARTSAGGGPGGGGTATGASPGAANVRREASPVLAAAQAALAAEHAAVYGYGAVGGRVGAGRMREARAAYDAHRAARDALVRTVTGLGGTPVAAAAAYVLPFAVPDRAAAVRLAAYLEERVAGAYGDLTRAGTGSVRRDAAAGLRAAAVRAVRWSGGSVAFPGLAERR